LRQHREAVRHRVQSGHDRSGWPGQGQFSGKLQLSDLNPPSSYSLAFEGSGGAAGFSKGGAQVSLAPEAGGTKLSYTAKATVGGKLAQVGSRLVDAAARKMADDFFSRFDATVAPPALGAPVVAKRAVPHWVWVLLAIVAAALIAFWALRAR
jgi:carbon monoxide dehydrogenase subunit G